MCQRSCSVKNCHYVDKADICKLAYSIFKTEEWLMTNKSELYEAIKYANAIMIHGCDKITNHASKRTARSESWNWIYEEQHL